jgi:hypothetical protein
MEGKIVALIIREELVVSYNGKTYSLHTESGEALFNGLKLTKEELGLIKKMPSNIKDVLLAKFFFKGKINGIEADKQTGFNL